MNQCIRYVLFTGAALFLLAAFATRAAADPVRLVAPNSVSLAHFGASVALSGQLLVVGAPDSDVGGNPGQGRVYVYRNMSGTWESVAQLDLPTAESDAHFGASVAIAPGRIVVGAPGASADGSPFRGAAFVFHRIGGEWQLEAKLASSDGRPLDRFGIVVAASAKEILVGAPWAGSEYLPYQGVGVAYLFELVKGQWLQRQVFADPSPYDLVGQFGSAVALHHGRALIGEPGYADAVGRSFLLERSKGTWQLIAIHDGPHGHGSAYGAVTALSNELGAVSEGYFGEVYLIIHRDTQWVYANNLEATPPESLPDFGWSLAVSGRQVAVGAPLTGLVYLYSVAADGSSQLQAELPVSGMRYGFGSALAMNQHWLAAGDSRDTVAGNVERGSVYLYPLQAGGWPVQ